MQSNKLTDSCPLCHTSKSSAFYSDKRRDYWQCDCCSLVFVPTAQRLPAAEEKAIYDLHNNSDDAGYRRFLNRLAEPLLVRLPKTAEGLDFGCGPGPVLAKMLEEAGHRVSLYDHFYAPEAERLQRQYDFIVATEVVEHLFQPGEELQRLWRCLRPGGWLGLMTKLVIDREAFSRWHYKNDPTHVCFFSRASFQWWAEQNAAQLTFIGNDVILLQKPVSG